MQKRKKVKTSVTNLAAGVWEKKSKRMSEFIKIFDFLIDFLMASAFKMMIYSTKTDEASQQLSNNYWMQRDFIEPRKELLSMNCKQLVWDKGQMHYNVNIWLLFRHVQLVQCYLQCDCCTYTDVTVVILSLCLKPFAYSYSYICL